MPATIIPGVYHLQFGLEFSESSANIPPPKPLYLTSNGEGKQLTVEKPTGQLNQEWNIQPPLNDGDSEYRIILPALSKEILEVWSFEQVRESDHLYEIRSNLYAGLVGSDPLLGVDKDFQKAIIQFIPVVADPPPRPVWKLLGPLNEKK